MNGWCNALTQEALVDYPSQLVTGVVVSKSFPDSKLIREKLEEGIAKLPPDTVWVMREKPASDHACSVAWAVLREHGIEPIHAAPNSAWWGSVARQQTDWELRHTCYRILVFHDGRSATTGAWGSYSWAPSGARGDGYVEGKTPCFARIFFIERGKAARKRKARKRVDV